MVAMCSRAQFKIRSSTADLFQAAGLTGDASATTLWTSRSLPSLVTCAAPLVIRVADGIDGVSANDIGYNKTFPYEGTPQNGRNHVHP